MLIERLEALGVPVERRTELVSFTDGGERVIARLRGLEGQEETCEASYIAGCDGARSIVRETIGTGFRGGTYRQLFYVADVEAAGPALDGELHVDPDEADFLAVFPLAGKGRARLIGTVRDERADHANTLKFEDVSDRAITNLKVNVQKVNWFFDLPCSSPGDRAFPQGPRPPVRRCGSHPQSRRRSGHTGIGDAINLAWKLATVLAGHAPDKLLDSYEAERIGFARRLVATTDRVFSFATAEGRIADILRTRLVPVLFPKVIAFEAVREYIFRTVSRRRAGTGAQLCPRRMPICSQPADESVCSGSIQVTDAPDANPRTPELYCPSRFSPPSVPILAIGAVLALLALSGCVQGATGQAGAPDWPSSPEHQDRNVPEHGGGDGGGGM